MEVLLVKNVSNRSEIGKRGEILPASVSGFGRGSITGRNDATAARDNRVIGLEVALSDLATLLSSDVVLRETDRHILAATGEGKRTGYKQGHELVPGEVHVHDHGGLREGLAEIFEGLR